MPTTARAEPEQIQEPRIQFTIPTVMAGIQLLAPSPTASQEVSIAKTETKNQPPLYNRDSCQGNGQY